MLAALLCHRLALPRRTQQTIKAADIIALMQTVEFGEPGGKERRLAYETATAGGAVGITRALRFIQK